jgi:hypothetical protein
VTLVDVPYVTALQSCQLTGGKPPLNVARHKKKPAGSGLFEKQL